MSNNADSLHSIRNLDDLSRADSIIHRLHPVVKLLATFVFLIAVVSFDKYEISGLLSFFLYPILLVSLAELPYAPIIKRLLMVSPFLVGIGISSVFFDSSMVKIAGGFVPGGWIVFLSILIKSSLTVTASILLLATTGMDNLGVALRTIHVPKIFVLLLLLTYRYISVLMEEVSRMTMAHSLRAPGQKGIGIRAWGSFTGQLILRTFDRAGRIYTAMVLRGFDGEYHTGTVLKNHSGWSSFFYFIVWTIFFVFARFYNIPALIGSLLPAG